jgi:hypothetical protein
MVDRLKLCEERGMNVFIMQSILSHPQANYLEAIERSENNAMPHFEQPKASA